MRYFIGDTETTGLTGPAVEVGLMEIDPVNLEPLRVWESLIDPECPIEPGAQGVHGISDEMVADAPTMSEYVTEIFGGRIEEPCTLIAHNVGFDEPRLIPIINVQARFCSLALSRRLYAGSGLPNHKLGTIREYFGLTGGEAHRAMGDVHTVHQFLKMCLPFTGRTLLDLLKIPKHTIYTMPWGQYQGMPLDQIPRGYRAWVILKSNADPDLKASLKKLHQAGI